MLAVPENITYTIMPNYDAAKGTRKPGNYQLRKTIIADSKRLKKLSSREFSSLGEQGYKTTQNIH